MTVMRSSRPVDLAALQAVVRSTLAQVRQAHASDALAFDFKSQRRFDVDGRMHVDSCNISKANVCPYFGREIMRGATNGMNLKLDPNRIYYLYRDPKELERAAPTFKNLQLLAVHTAVNADKPKQEITVGTIGSDARFESPYLKASVAVWTAEGVALVESKQQAQLSASYRYRADMQRGTSPDGVAFDGVMRDIMGNHVALVEEGRAGSDCYVSDSQPLEFKKMLRPNLTALIATALMAMDISLADEQKLALDAAMSKACDEDLDDEETKKRKAEDAAKKAACAPAAMDTAVANAAAMDAAVSAAINARGLISKTEADKLANDAAAKAVAAERALHKARKDVEPLVGVVAMDSAEEVYGFALKQEKVPLEGVHVSAYGALVEQVKAKKSAAAATVPTGTPRLASDAAPVSSIIPGLSRFQVAG